MPYRCERVGTLVTPLHFLSSSLSPPPPPVSPHLRSGARWQDLVLTVHWMLDFHASGQEQMLWDLAELLHQQVRGGQ